MRLSTSRQWALKTWTRRERSRDAAPSAAAYYRIVASNRPPNARGRPVQMEPFRGNRAAVELRVPPDHRVELRAKLAIQRPIVE